MPTQVELLKKYGLSVRGHLGQHLLIDPNMQRKIVGLLDPGAGDFVLEIGPGLGALTGHLLERGVRVFAIERDPVFAGILKKEFASFKGRLVILEEDILKINLKKLLGARAKRKGWKVIGNLPYYITAPILFTLMEHRSRISRAVLTMQKEVADRLIASPGTKDYGRLTLGVRYAADVRHAFDIAPSCFTPQPEVDSSVITLTFHSQSALRKRVDEAFLFHLIRLAFSQRRKTLLHLLVRDKKIKMGREELLQILRHLGFSQTVRGEELLLKDYMVLTKFLKKG